MPAAANDSAADSSESPVKETIPMWLAVPATVVIAMPFGLWLGRFNFALWCCFIVWAEYFALGGKPAGLRLILPSFSYAAIVTGLTLFAHQGLSSLPSLVTQGDVAISLALFVGVAFMVYSMRWTRTFQAGSLPFFNGISMGLAIFFTASYPKVGPEVFHPLVAAGWTVLMGSFGALLGVFNVWITFPRKSASAAAAATRGVPASTIPTG
jgi:hypothetical protein